MVVRAREHVGIGHARHWHVSIRFAAAIAGRCNAHQAGVELVLHVAFEHAVLHQDVVLPGRTLIVDR